MNETISAALRDHADGDIHIERLLGAVHAGARRRRQRRVAVVGAALAVVVVLASVSAATPVPRSTPVGGPVLTRPPLVAATSAADSPEVLGADPTLFHLDLVGLTDWRALAWSVRPGHRSDAAH